MDVGNSASHHLNRIRNEKRPYLRFAKLHHYRAAIEFSVCPWFRRRRRGGVYLAKHFAVFGFQ
jgi:hypothetical protein